MAVWTTTVSAPSDLSIPPIAQNIGFQAQSVVVDNFTPYWLYIPLTLGYVAPWTTDVVRGFLHATDYVKVIWQSPIDDTQSINATAKFVSFLFTDAIIPASSGTLAYGIAQQVATAPSTEYLLSGVKGFGGIAQAIYALNTPVQLTKLNITNNGTAPIVPVVKRLTNDSVSGGSVISGVPLDPNNPTYANLTRQHAGFPFQTASKFSNGATSTIVLPASIPTGSLILVAYYNIDTTSIVTPPNGYTLIRLDNLTPGIFGVLVSYYRVATGTESGSNVSLVWNGASNVTAGVVIIPTPNVAIGGENNGVQISASTAFTFNPVTPTGSPQLIFSIAGAKNNVTFTPPATTTELIDASPTNGTIWMGTQINTADSPVTPGTATASAGSNGRTQTISITQSLLTANLGSTLLTLPSLAAGSNTIYDASSDNIVGRLGAGFAITSDATLTQPYTVESRVKLVT